MPKPTTKNVRISEQALADLEFIQSKVGCSLTAAQEFSAKITRVFLEYGPQAAASTCSKETELQ